MATNSLFTSATAGFGGVVHEYLWNWENQQIRTVYETLGTGTPLLLLPAFSTVSMRSEMSGIGQLLADNFQVVAVDWPGFGESTRLTIDYNPALYQQFLEDFVRSVFQTPVVAIAAGHSSAYVLQVASKNATAFSRIVLVAPTWRGPLPTMGMDAQIASFVRGLVRSPIIGQALYKLNTLPSFLRFMYRRHVYVDPTKLTPSFIQHKWRNTQQPGARFAPAAFVTGHLDAVNSRTDFLNLVQGLSVPLMIVVAESAPPKSRAEMDALVALPQVRSVTLPGTLGLHEEYPDAVVAAVRDFLLPS